MSMDLGTLRVAIRENQGQPEGPARNARAEALLAEAEGLTEPLALIEALGHQVQVYNYSSEKGKMFVPFSRLLRLWDAHPEHFDSYETHSLHWVFKWVSAGMLDQPDIPLASIERWLAEMERRYRLAGHSVRAVRMVEFDIARHVGDEARARRAFDGWLGADRDTMSDCHACELNGQGAWQAQWGLDEEALDLWAPVLAGEHVCAHEPHAVLSASLVPLLRLGRTAQARAHHLRGFRLVRPMESMRSAFAHHVEFCALSGNEARGLELLTERPAYFTDDGQPHSLMDFLSVTALLTDRLTALGHGAQTVPGPTDRAAPWTARDLAVVARSRALEIAARFDTRNGTDEVSRLLRARMDQEPLVDRLPLGVRSVRPAPSTAPSAAAAAADAAAVGDGAVAEGLDALLMRARALTARMHPSSVDAWSAVARGAEEQGVVLAPADRAELLKARARRATTGPAEAAEFFAEAAALHTAAGDVGEALITRARAAAAPGREGSPEEAAAALPVLDALRTEALAVFAAGGSRRSQLVSTLIPRARVLSRLAHAPAAPDAPGMPGGWEEVAQGAAHEVLTLVGNADQDGAEGDAAPDRHAAPESGPVPDDALQYAAFTGESYTLLAELALRRGEAAEAAGLYARGVEEFVDAGLTWFALDSEATLSGLLVHLGDLDGAERVARSALEHAGSFVEARGQAQLHLQLADVLNSAEQLQEAAAHALEAAHWADQDGQSEAMAAWARFRLGGFLIAQGRSAEAAVILESALYGLDVEAHGDGAVVQARWWLGDCHRTLGEYQEAAQQWMRAAELAQHWPDQQDHAVLANLAADALSNAERPREAERAYARAGELWTGLGNVSGTVRTLRARAWLLSDEEPGQAASLMEAAADACATALDGAERAAAHDGTVARDGAAALLAELAHTHHQHGELLAGSFRGEPGEGDTDGSARRAYEGALALVEHAVAGFRRAAEADPEAVDTCRDGRTAAELTAAWLCADLGQAEQARTWARGVREAYGDDDSDTARRRLRSVGEILDGLAKS